MISFIKNIFHRITCKHKYFYIKIHLYHDYSGLPIQLEIHKCCKCGKIKKVKRW